MIELLTKLAATILKSIISMAPLIGAIMIGMGIKRFMDGNNGPNQGRGALTKIFVGSLFLCAKPVLMVILNTLAKSGFNVSKIVSMIN